MYAASALNCRIYGIAIAYYVYVYRIVGGRMKLSILFIIFSLFSANAMANDLWSEFNVKKAKSEIDYTQGLIEELQELSKFVPREQFNSKLKDYKNNMRKTLSSLEAHEKRTLIQNYENANPKLAATLKGLK